MANYSYLADGTRTSAVGSDGSGLVRRGSLTYRKAADGSLEFEGADFDGGRFTAGQVIYHITDHLGSVIGIVRSGSSSPFEYDVYDAYGSRTRNQLAAPFTPEASLRFGFTGKEDQSVEFSVPYSDSLSYTPAGNVYSWRWQQGEQQGWQHTAYYDAFGRMSDLWTSELSVPGSTDFSSFGYDSNNNLILTGGETFTTDGNQRTRYSYDANGNVTYDNESDIEITYNVLNLPNNIFLTGPAMDVPFVYTADGRKVEMSPGASFIYYYGPFRYENGVLKYIFISGGYVEKAGNTYASRFVVSDHLGSTRAIIDAGGTIIQQNDYDTWGENTHQNSLISGNFPYLYGGKESLELFDIPYYDSIARLQTTDGVFLNADPLAEASYATGPYAYCAGNPLSMTDPLGLTRYMVDGVPHDIDDGYNETIEVTADEFWAMTAYYGAKNFGAYNLLRIMYMNTYGYTTGEGQLVLAVSKKEEDSVMITQGPLLFAREDEPYWNPGTGFGVNSAIYSFLSKERFNNKYWRDANYVKQPLSKKGSNRIGKKQWAKARSIRFNRIGKALGFAGVSMDAYLLIDDYISNASSLTIAIHWVDIGIDAAGYIPYVGPVISITYPFYRDALIDNVITPAYEHLSQ